MSVHPPTRSTVRSGKGGLVGPGTIVERMDRSDAESVGGALERVVQAIGAILNGTDAQVGPLPASSQDATTALQSPPFYATWRYVHCTSALL